MKKYITCAAILSLGLTFYTPTAYASDNVLGTLAGAAGGAWVGSQFGKGSGKVASIAVGTLVGAALVGSMTSSAYAVQPVSYNHTVYEVHKSHGYGYQRHHGHHPNRYNHYNRHNPHRVHYSNPRVTNYYVNNVSYSNDFNRYPMQYTGQTFNRNGQYCREFTQNISVGGRQQQGYGIACQQPDGSWQISGE